MGDSDNEMVHMAMTHIPPVPVSFSKEKIRQFDCAICSGSLEEEGPSLQLFSFGKLLTANPISIADQEIIIREFFTTDPCCRCGTFDCTKVITTPCGHLFHSGCIREWFFTRRYDRHAKCPFCNSRASYDECQIIHPLAVAHTTDCLLDENSSDDDEDVPQLIPNSELKPPTVELDYSDISCVSSSYSTDEEDLPIDLEMVKFDDPVQQAVHIAREHLRMTQIEMDNRFAMHMSELDDNDILVDLERVERDVEETTAQLNSFLAAGDNLDVNPEVEVEIFLLSDQSQLHPKDTIMTRFWNLIKFCGDCNIIYIFFLAMIFVQVNSTHEERLSVFEKSWENAEDENLENFTMVPLGYNFVAQMICTGMAIGATEGVLSIFKKKCSFLLKFVKAF